jgi:hypothetical protein
MHNSRIAKILAAISGLHTLTKKYIRFGTVLFLVLFSAGTALLLTNGIMFDFSLYLSNVSRFIVKNSFTILAEVIIGCLLIDLIFKQPSAS